MTSRPAQRTGPEVVLHEERARVSTARDAVRAVVRRRITSETRTVEVTVRREVLEVEYLPVGEVPEPAATSAHEPLVLVLSEEVPVVEVVTRPYEQVTVSVQRFDELADVATRLAREQAEVSSD